jgi:hypothetical protein
LSKLAQTGSQQNSCRHWCGSGGSHLESCKSGLQAAGSSNSASKTTRERTGLRQCNRDAARDFAHFDDVASLDPDIRVAISHAVNIVSDGGMGPQRRRTANPARGTVTNMESRLDVITLAVADLERALAFYRALGLESKGIIGTEPTASLPLVDARRADERVACANNAEALAGGRLQDPPGPRLPETSRAERL